MVASQEFNMGDSSSMMDQMKEHGSSQFLQNMTSPKKKTEALTSMLVIQSVVSIEDTKLKRSRGIERHKFTRLGMR